MHPYTIQLYQENYPDLTVYIVLHKSDYVTAL